MRIRTPTVRQIESALKRYAVQLSVAVLGTLAVFVRDRLIGGLLGVSNQILSQAVFWLALAMLVATLLLAFYFYRCRVLEKAILQLDPNYYQGLEFDKAFKEATRSKKS